MANDFKVAMNKWRDDYNKEHARVTELEQETRELTKEILHLQAELEKSKRETRQLRKIINETMVDIADDEFSIADDLRGFYDNL